MSLFNNASNLFINGNSVSLAYLNGNQIFSASIAEVGGGGSSIITSGLVLNLDAGDYGGSGDWLDTSGNNNDGTLVQTPTYSSNDGGYFDFTGGSYSTAGTALYDHIRILDDSTLDSLSSITFEMWINIDSIDGSPTMLFSKRATNNDGYVGLLSPTAFTFRVGTGVGTGAIWSTTPSTVTWQQIVVTIGSGGSKIYQNGVEVADVPSYTGVFASANTNADLLLGDLNPSNTGPYAFNGKMSIFRIYNTILSGTDILDNFNAVKDRYGL